MTKEELKKVYEEVCENIRDGFYVNTRGEEIPFKKTWKLKSETALYTPENIIPEIQRPEFETTRIYVENIDSFEKAIQLGKDTAVLNMASYRNPGGGVASGSRAQEEELCRRSNLLLSLYGVYGMKGWVWRSQEFDYPIPTYGAIYTPSVNIYRSAKTYTPFLDGPILTNVISGSMIIRPGLTEDGKIEKKYVHMIKKKIRCILRTAILTKNTKLVLGAWGCGAYGCPSKHMAEIFQKVLGEDEFKKSFKEICFAILEDQNSVRENNPEGNLKPFKDTFGL